MNQSSYYSRIKKHKVQKYLLQSFICKSKFVLFQNKRMNANSQIFISHENCAALVLESINDQILMPIETF